MYRQGLGDCFLISLPRTDGATGRYYVMIDCGVILGTADPGTMMTQVIENIVAVTGGEIDILIATHDHWDHVSGFVQARESVRQAEGRDEVWLAWTGEQRRCTDQENQGRKGQALCRRCAWD